MNNALTLLSFIFWRKLLKSLSFFQDFKLEKENEIKLQVRIIFIIYLVTKKIIVLVCLRVFSQGHSFAIFFSQCFSFCSFSSSFFLKSSTLFKSDLNWKCGQKVVGKGVKKKEEAGLIEAKARLKGRSSVEWKWKWKWKWNRMIWKRAETLENVS